MREQKIHIRLKGKPVCGTHANKIKFATAAKPATCNNCKRAVEK